MFAESWGDRTGIHSLWLAALVAFGSTATALTYVGILHDRLLPLIEIRPADGLYDYDAKYDRDDTTYVLDPPLPEPVIRVCRDASARAYRRLGCRDLARVDFMVDDETAWFLEINTMPGFTSHSLVPMAAAHAGVDMPGLCAGLVDAALARASTAQPAAQKMG